MWYLFYLITVHIPSSASDSSGTSRTRSRCSKTSLMVQKEENEKTPNRVDSRI